MSRIKTLVVLALMATFAMSALGVASAAALSTNSPQWQLEAGSKILGEGESKEVVGEQKGAQLLKSSVATISCKTLSLSAGATIKGSKAPAPGTSAETIKYGECEVKGFSECKINGEASGKAKLETKALKDTLVFETKAAAEKEAAPTSSLFEPAAGKVFIEFELSGTCPITGKIKVEGKVVASNVGGENFAVTHEINSKGAAEYFVNVENKTTKKFETKKEKSELKAFGVKSTYEGVALVTLSSKEKWRVFN